MTDKGTISEMGVTVGKVLALVNGVGTGRGTARASHQEPVFCLRSVLLSEAQIKASNYTLSKSI